MSPMPAKQLKPNRGPSRKATDETCASRKFFPRVILHSRLSLVCVFLLFGALFSRGLDIYLVRHAETLGNVTGDYSEENQRIFSPKGLQQIASLSEKLNAYHFDRILVSPTYRTRQTILPYLHAQGSVAEIWPELEECCCDSRGSVSPAAAVPLGEPITMDEAERAYFRVRPDGQYHLRPSTEAEGMAQLANLRKRLLEHFGGTTQSVLLVTHSCTGSRIMELLLGIKPAGRFSPDNAALSLLRESPPGIFRLILYNDAPFEQRYYWVSSTGEEAIPGKPFRLKLVPRFFAQQTRLGYHVRWTLHNGSQRRVARGEEFFAPGNSGGEEGVLEIEIPTIGARYGDRWTLGTALLAEDALLHRWTMTISFPAYHSLAGSWRIQAGDDLEWASPHFDDSAWPTSRVPGGWEADALPSYDGIAWYRKTFVVPPDKRALWRKQPLAVLLGAVDDADETYLNGVCIGRSGLFPPEGVTAWDQPRLYSLDTELLQETNVLAVRVSDWGGGGGIWKGPVAIGPQDELRLALESGFLP